MSTTSATTSTATTTTSINTICFGSVIKLHTSLILLRARVESLNLSYLADMATGKSTTDDGLLYKVNRLI